MTALLSLDPKGTAVEVLRAARRRGMDVLVMASDPALVDDAVRSLCAAVTPVESWEDLPRIDAHVAALAERFEITGVYFSLDATAAAGSRIRARLGLPAVPQEVVEACRDKGRLRRRLAEAGLSTLRSVPEAEAEALTAWPFPGAAYFKPTHGCGSAFVTRVTSLAELAEATAAFRRGRPTDPLWVRNYLASHGAGFHLEEEIRGELLSVEALSCGGEFRPLGLLSRILYSRNEVVEMGSVFPYPHPRARELLSFVAAVHAAIGFLEGPTHTEVIVGDDGRMELIDFNPRIVGADVLWSINHALGCQLEEALLDWALGGKPEVPRTVRGYSCLQYVLPPEPLTFESLALPDDPRVLYRKVFPSPGDVVRSTDQQMDYLGCYLTFEATFAGAKAASAALRPLVRVNGRLPGSF